MIPKFAVVGRVNEGKSSVIATLTENDQIGIGPTPGTTTETRKFVYRSQGKDIIEVYDTPGFQEPERAFTWLQETYTGPATGRPQAIQRFVETFANSREFSDECELLEPILAGAAILYVIDASHPYRPSYESEFEILRWTGRPRMALINSVRDTDFSEEWKRSLSQHFNLVFSFNAHKADFGKRLELLHAMRLLDSDVTQGVDEAITIFEAERRDRVQDTAQIMAAFLQESLTYRFVTDDSSVSEHHGMQSYREAIRQLEVSFRKDLRKRFNFSTYFENRTPLGVVDSDIFAERTWRVLGLNAKQLIAAAATAGATLGLGIDIALGGQSFLL